MKLPSEMPSDALVALIDTREQTELTLPGLQTEPATLPTGDYSVKGMESHVAIERKSLPDMVACCGRERERFDREVQRLKAYPVRALVIEGSWQDIECANWRGKMTARQVGGSITGWMASGLPVVLAGDRKRAGVIVASILRHTARRRWRKLRTFAQLIPDR